MGNLLIRGGTVVRHDGVWRMDVRCRDGRIVQLGVDLEPEGEPVVEASGTLVLPGVIDPHLHFSLVAAPHRTADDFDTGSAAALTGGVTAYIDFAHQRKGESLTDAIRARMEEPHRSRADYSLHVIVTDLSSGQRDELSTLTSLGVTSAKVYTTYKQAGFFCDDYTIRELMQAGAAEGWVIMVHCENDAVVEGTRASLIQQGKVGFEYHAVSRPAISEIEAVQRMILFCRETGCPTYLVHLSTGEAARMVNDGRHRGIPVIGETCPHFLLESDYVYTTDRGVRFIHTPPLRSDQDRETLWQALAQEWLHTVASDHCGYTLRQRTDYNDITKVAPGIPGVEFLLPLIYTYGVASGRIDLPKLVKILCYNPAVIFGLYPRKGAIAVGADADLALFDLDPVWTLEDSMVRSAAGYTPYAGMELKGRVVKTVLRGKVVFDGRDVIAEPGYGKFIPRRPVYAKDLP